MKKILYLSIVSFILCTVTSCSNDQSFIESEFEKTEVIVLKSEEELVRFIASTLPKDEKDSGSSNIETRATSDWRSVKGYYSMEDYRKNIRMVFTNNLGPTLGVQDNVPYLCDVKFVYGHIVAWGSFVPNLNSPNCGLRPNMGSEMGFDSWASRGYMQFSITGTSYMNRTVLFYVNREVSGNIKDKYYPCTPSSIVWEYKDIY